MHLSLRQLTPVLTLVLTVSVMPAAHAAPTTVDGKRCTVVGTSGNDVLVGTSADNVICGLGGRDVIKGMGGNDSLDGGSGSDRIVGGTGADQIRGGSGNDDLTGGAGSDVIDGGLGTDWCTVDSVDVLTRCVYDRDAPSAGTLKIDPSATVDVTRQSASISFAINITDDTGVRQVQVMAQDSTTGHALNPGLGGLVTGTVRDGTWRSHVQVPRYAPPGRFTVEVIVTDRVGRTSSATFFEALRVRNLTPDYDRPDVELLAPLPSTVVDVRTSSKTVVIRARITDAVSGVANGPYFCAEYPMNDFYTHDGCINADQVSGSMRDGIWEARVTIPARAIGGDWNVSVWATDNARPAEILATVGPDIMRAWTMDGAETTARAFPNERGRFTVRGALDSNPPSLTEVQLSPSRVDTLEREASVSVRARALDLEGVMSIGLALHPLTTDSSAVSFAPIELALIEGTISDGWWTGVLTLPRGTPPGRYAIQIWVRDATHWRSYVSTSSPYAGAGQGTIAGSPDPVVTVIER